MYTPFINLDLHACIFLLSCFFWPEQSKSPSFSSFLSISTSVRKNEQNHKVPLNIDAPADGDDKVSDDAEDEEEDGDNLAQNGNSKVDARAWKQYLGGDTSTNYIRAQE